MARKEVPTDFCEEYPRNNNNGTIKKPPPNPVNEAPMPTNRPRMIMTSMFAFMAANFFRTSKI